MGIATKNRKELNIALWLAQSLLALVFLMAGFMKSTRPIAELATSLPWVNEVSAGLVRFIGISELLGGMGLVLPSILRIRPGLTALAASGLALVMVFALIFHIVKGEYNALVINVVLGAIAYFIYWGRTKRAPIEPKNK